MPTAAPSRQALRVQLVDAAIAGDVATGRRSVTDNARRMADREPNWMLGLDLSPTWTYASVVALMADRVGVDPDAERTEGADRIDPDRCLDGLDRAAERLRDVARARGRVLLATGHPTGLLPVHQAVARALRRAGCTLLTPGDGAPVELDGRPARVLAIGDVLVAGTSAHLLHTHWPDPMRVALAADGPVPDLVVADHGWAGAAGAAGLLTVGYADCNDPALFAGEAEGLLAVTVPLDDNVVPSLYAPMTAYLLAAAGLTGDEA